MLANKESEIVIRIDDDELDSEELVRKIKSVVGVKNAEVRKKREEEQQVPTRMLLLD